MTEWIDFYWFWLNSILLSPTAANEPVYMWKTGDWHSGTFHNFLPSSRKHVPTCQERAATVAESRETLTVIDNVLYWSARGQSWNHTFQ